MLSEKGTAQSLKEIGEKFLAFAQKSNSNTQAWELLDDRLSTFYGATLRVKIPNMTINNTDPYFYISLQHTDVTKTTYAEWLMNTPDYYGSELFYRDSRAQYFGNYGGLNPFIDTGEFIAVGLHTLYDEDLWMCEQGQITCEKEATAQINMQNLDAANYIYNQSGEHNASTEFVSFPGVGCPWLTISDNDKKNTSITKPIEYWFTKTDTDATITYRLNSLIPRWQSMSFGMMRTFKNDNYQFPLYVAGGTQGIAQNMTVFVPVYGSYPTYTKGNYYYLGMDNTALANSNLLYPTKFNDSNVSNFKILAPDGEWKNIFSKEQKVKAEAVFTCYGRPDDFVYYLTAPIPYTDEHSGIPLATEFDWMIDTYTVNESWSDLKSSASINDIMVVLNNQIPYYAGGVMGVIPNTFYSWSQSLRSGELEIEGKKWLSVPNGWDKRKKIYRTYNGVVNVTDNQKVLAQDESDNANDKIFCHNILIPLEDFDSTTTPTVTSTTETKTTVTSS